MYLFWIQILFCALLILSGVLEPIKCSQKVQTPPSGHNGRVSYTRQDQRSAEEYLNPKQIVFDPGLVHLLEIFETLQKVCFGKNTYLLEVL
uniref:Uncharacterized protein n=1 Tax=Anguilla anguilla TaxID=7936 RepID=A0A0E9X2H2_ANGAN